jgi:nucleotide-binding universal stress UspA family protein
MVKGVKAGAAWVNLECRPIDIMLQRGRYADRAVICQTAGYDVDLASEYSLPADLVMMLGRPALVVPAGRSFAEVGRNGLIAWKPVREAARAMADALPFIAGSGKTTIMLFNPEAGESEGHELGRYVGRHGIDGGTIAVRSKTTTVGEAILSTANDMSADLPVMGVYGHARLSEMVLGGATHTVLRNAELPVLMSH